MAKANVNFNPKALRELTVTVGENEINEFFEKVAKEYQKKAKIQGFRQGKAPIEIVKRLFEKDILEDAQEEAIKSKIYEELKSKEELIVSDIFIKEKKEEGQGITVTVEYEALPTFSMPKLNSIKVEKKVKRVSDIDVDDEIEKYRNKLGKLVPVDRESKENDYLIVDYREIENGKVKKVKQNLSIQVSPEVINPEILEKFLNKKKGDSIELEFEDEKTKKPIKISYLIKEVAELQLPEVNDEFAKTFGYESLEKMKEDIKEYLTKQREKASEDELEWKIIDEIFNRVQFEPPRTLVEEKITRLAESFRYNPKDQEVRKSFEKIAEDLVKKEIILKNYIDQEGLEATEEEIQKSVEEKAKIYRMEPEKYRKELEKRGLLDNIIDEILRKKALEQIKNSVKVEVVLE